MAVQFPCNFVVAHQRELEKGNFEPGFQRRTFFVDAIQMPVDLRAVVKIFVAQQPEMMAPNIIGLVKNFQSLGRQMRAQQFSPFSRSTGREEEFRSPCRSFVKSHGFGWQADPVAKKVAPLVDFLAQARVNLVPIHLGQSSELVLPFQRHYASILPFGRNGASIVSPATKNFPARKLF